MGLGAPLAHAITMAALAPCMLTVTTRAGLILSQNPESCARIGCHMPPPTMKGEGRQQAPATNFNYLQEIFAGQEVRGFNSPIPAFVAIACGYNTPDKLNKLKTGGPAGLAAATTSNFSKRIRNLQ